MSRHLVLTIHLHELRYHGAEWPPAPARVFQALVAGVARGRSIPEPARRALEWFERLPPPVVAVPHARTGTLVSVFVPNNDADSVGGDPSRLGELRTKKQVLPRLPVDDTPLVYAWPLDGESPHAAAIVEAAEQLYQLGRGVDMAWAVGELLDEEDLDARLAAYRGVIHRPERAEPGATYFQCPAAGALASLVTRYRANLERLRADGEAKGARTLFAQAPKPRFASVAYGTGVQRRVYELRHAYQPDGSEDDTKLRAWPLVDAPQLIERIRDAAAARLVEALPELQELVERHVIGRRGDGVPTPKAEQRVRMIPLPSIGHVHVDRGVRRILVEVPAECPLHADDVLWGFSNLQPDEYCILIDSDDRSMLGHYGVEGRSSHWRSVTPVALPIESQRRRIEPARRREEAKGAAERAEEEARAVAAVRTALRHAGVRASATRVFVQREPFEARGARAEDFAPNTRFAKERLWHVELELSEALEGPLVLGDGRFLGLGVMAPVRERLGVFGVRLSGDVSNADGEALARALRRAIMSRAQEELGNRPLGRFFSGHENDGTPARSQESSHIAIQWDPARGRLLVFAPHVLDHRRPTFDEQRSLEVLGRVMESLVDLRAGRAGRFALEPVDPSELREYCERSKTWHSVRPYTVTRHGKSKSPEDVIAADVLDECARRGLPRPTVTVLRTRGVSGRGLQGALRLEFSVAVEGPIALGRTRYLGGGLFCPQLGTHTS